MSEFLPNRMVKAGNVVFHEGDEPTGGMFYICYGEVEVSRKIGNSTRVLARLKEGDIFGEMSLINSQPRNATVTALQDCGFYTVTRETFQHRVYQLEPMMRGVFRMFVLTIRDFLAREEEWQKNFEPKEIELKPLGESLRGEDTGSIVDGYERKMQF